MQKPKHLNSKPNHHNNNKMFFQPLLPDFLDSFSIPCSYMKHLEADLKGHPLESIVLMTQTGETHHHWVVHIKGGRHFNNQDWRAFANHHHLRVGDFVVFTHKSNFLFHVSVFDPVSACERHSLHPLPRSRTKPKPNPNPEDIQKQAPKTRFRQSNFNTKGKSQAVAAASRPPPRKRLPKYPTTCTINISAYSIRKSVIYLPKHFVRRSGLENTKCDVKIIDHKQRSWPVYLSYRGDSQSYINRGWKDVQLMNELKRGDAIQLQVLQAGDNPVFKCTKLSPSKAKVNRSKGRFVQSY